MYTNLIVLWPELARDALNSQGFCVIGGYMSPVNDAYKKKVHKHTTRYSTCLGIFFSYKQFSYATLSSGHMTSYN